MNRIQSADRTIFGDDRPCSECDKKKAVIASMNFLNAAVAWLCNKE